MTDDARRADYGIPGFDPGFDQFAGARRSLIPDEAGKTPR
jgi:hypothetical protein